MIDQELYVAAIVSTMATITNQGATVSSDDGDQPTTGYVVALGNPYSTVVPNVTNDSMFQWIIAFAVEHDEILMTAGHYIGTWLNDGMLYLDVAQVIEDREEAVAAGIARNQIAIYEIETGTTISTGGNGQ